MIKDPFRIDGPAVVSFSGGRTSAYMLWRIIQAYGGELPSDVLVIFANTGKEMPQTLDFVRDCGERWGVPITWVEYADHDEVAHRWRTVTYETASRSGEPFASLIKRRNFLPNILNRYCTTELKLRPMSSMLVSRGWSEWTAAVGLRADEMPRVARIKASRLSRQETVCPLATAGITKSDVQAFWNHQNFDLRLLNINGKTPHGNCDLCFLKPIATLRSIMRDIPGSSKWWIEQEGLADGRWRLDYPPYSQLAANVSASADLFAEDGRATDCFCNGDT
jgi:3'-phosphoadenosine 5'-phosphosulfate sulfotransferase (PAPS reductase)/FAD synthetase